MREGRSAFELAIERGRARQPVAELKRERDLRYSEMLRKQTRVLPDVPETLQQLQGRLRMAVVTSSQRQHFDVMHSDTGLTRYFEFVLAREDFRETKPNPEPYLLALERLRMKADNCVAAPINNRTRKTMRTIAMMASAIPRLQGGSASNLRV